MQDYTSSNAQDNAIALQKFGVGQPVRRKEDDTLVRGKGKYTDDFSLPGQAYAWIVRSSHAHGIIRGIDTDAAKAMPGVLGVWTGADLAVGGLWPLHLRPAAEEPRWLAAAADQPSRIGERQGAFCRRPRGVCGGRDAGAGARRRRSRGARYRSVAGSHQRRGSGKARRAAALRSHPEQCGARLSFWRRRQGRRRLRRSRACDQARYRQYPRGRGGDGAARGAGLLRQSKRALYDPGSDPGRRRQSQQCSPRTC